MSVFQRQFAQVTDPAQFDLRPQGSGAVLDLGCGNRKVAGAIGVDIAADTDADIVHNLDIRPWPLEDSAFDEVLLQDVIEHVAEPFQTMEEIHRVCRPGAIVQLRTPHFSSALAYGDPTHHHYLSLAAVRSLADPGFAHYGAARFEVLSARVDSWLPYRLLGIEAAANRWPDLYEQYLAFIFTSMNIRAVFRVNK